MGLSRCEVALDVEGVVDGSMCRKGFVTPTIADVSFVGKMADGNLVRSPPIPT